MAKGALFQSGEFPCHLWIRSNNREHFPVDPRYAWKTFTGELLVQQMLYGLRTHAFVLMPNHLHLLISSQKREIGEVMRDFISSATRILNTKAQRSGRIFGGRYRGAVVSDPRYYAHVLKYVIRNPAKAGLIDQVGMFPYSTYSGEVGEIPLPLAIYRPALELDSLVPEDPEERDRWLNEPHPAELNRAIRNGLREKQFGIRASRGTRRKLDLSIS